MNSITYKIKRDIVSRLAANLAYSLNDTTYVCICKNGINFNGKSLIGILSNRLYMGDIITIKIEKPEDMIIVKEAFKEIGEVIE